MGKVAKGKIRLRVVGVYYDDEFDAVGISNIKDLLDAAVLKGKGSFTYEPKVKCKMIGGKATIMNSLMGFTHQLKPAINPSLGLQDRRSGFYSLFQTTSVERGSETVHAWQYYIIRAHQSVSNVFNGDPNEYEVSPATPPKSNPGFTSFDMAKLKEGDEVVWRNVSIVRNPQTEPIY